MGQRHQCFIQTHNFSKAFYADKDLDKPKKYKDDLPKFMELTLQKKKDDDAFGIGEKTICSYHHQWLYGRSAPLACLNILDFLDGVKNSYDTNPFHPEHGKYNRDNASPKEIVKSITSILSLFRDNQLSPYTRCGIENFSFLNYDEPDMREDFSLGDNNDGIFIVDASTKKYCFMNIYDQDTDNTSASALPKLTPVSAIDYIEAYYPSTMTLGAKAHIKWLFSKENSSTDKKADVAKYEKEMKSNASINKKFARRFKKYGVLTIEEVRAMFPNMTEIQPVVETSVENIREKQLTEA